jgi:hypothetical protein
MEKFMVLVVANKQNAPQAQQQTTGPVSFETKYVPMSDVTLIKGTGNEREPSHPNLKTFFRCAGALTFWRLATHSSKLCEITN